MPPRRVTTRATGNVRRAGDEPEHPAVPPVDQDAMRQMVQEAVQQATQDVARQAAQEAARLAAQEVVRQMAAAQGPQIPMQQAPPVQIPAQQVPLPQVPAQQEPAQQFAQGVQPPPPPPLHPQARPGYDDRFFKLARQMKDMDMNHFGGTTEPTVAHDWKLGLERKMEIIDCPPEFSLRLAMQYLRGDALVWWDGVRLSNGPGNSTFEDFQTEFDKKYFPKEALDRKKSAFEHVSQGTMTIREYEVEFSRLRRFAGVNMSEEDLIRKFLDGMRVDIRNRCRVITYLRLGDLVEKAAEQEAGLAEERQLFQAAQPKVGKAPESQGSVGGQLGLRRCTRCRRSHRGDCLRCRVCHQFGHIARFCRAKPFDVAPARQVAAPRGPVAAPAAPVAIAGNCYGCNQPGHMIRDCPRRGNAALPPPPKRLAIAPRVFAVGDPQGAEPIAGMSLVVFIMF